eukprot:COSAG01_NODE_5365_length_4308_cov_1.852697_5_plen_157_part_00
MGSGASVIALFISHYSGVDCCNAVMHLFVGAVTRKPARNNPLIKSSNASVGIISANLHDVTTSVRCMLQCLHQINADVALTPSMIPPCLRIGLYAFGTAPLYIVRSPPRTCASPPLSTNLPGSPLSMALTNVDVSGVFSLPASVASQYFLTRTDVT